ncbi:MAG: response regulator transcription factor [Phycisphaerae bacterium]
MNSRIAILLVDDHMLVRDTLSERLNREPDMTVVGVVGNADDAVSQSIAHQPNIILMDIDMPGLLPFDAARTIHTHCADTRIIFLSAFFHDRYIEQALAAGACGYVTKDEGCDTLVRGIRDVASGDAYFSPEVQSRIVVDSNGARLAGGKCSLCSTLTSRELEILRYIARGLSKKDTAAVAHISVKTVENHCANLMAKLHIHDRVELARFAIREGLAEA